MTGSSGFAAQGVNRARDQRVLKSKDGHILLGDDLLADWRARAARGTARVRGYYAKARSPWMRRPWHAREARANI